MLRIFLVLPLFLSALLSSKAEARGGDWQEIPLAHYTVPNVARYGKFEVRDLKFRNRDGKMEIEYSLPLYLTGTKITMEAKASEPGSSILSGPMLQASCSEDFRSCAMSYINIPATEESVREFLLNEGLPADEVSGRIEVFRAFRGGDPGGVLSY